MSQVGNHGGIPCQWVPMENMCSQRKQVKKHKKPQSRAPVSHHNLCIRVARAQKLIVTTTKRVLAQYRAALIDEMQQSQTPVADFL